jgi:adenylate kinase
LVGQATVLLGPPASGKGTQGRLLAAAENFAYLSTGRQLRKEVADNTPRGRLAGAFLREGQYVPDDLVVDLVNEWIGRARRGWVLDGFPRTMSQAEDLDRILAAKASSLRAVLFDVDSDELERRVVGRRECQECSWTGNIAEAVVSDGKCPCCGSGLQRRFDDIPENFRKRLKEFQDLTLPVASYYEESGRLLKVCGVGSQEEVFKKLRFKLT